MADVIEINDIEALDDYREAWHRLLPGTPHASFFHTLEWLETYWKHLRRDQALKVLVVKSGERVIGIVPLVVRRETYRLATVRVLTYPLDNCGTWYGPIGPMPGTTMLAAMQYIREAPRDWDMIELRWCGASNGSLDKSSRAMRVAGLLTAKQSHQSTSIVELDGNWEGYLASRSHNHRHRIRSVLRRGFENGDIRYFRHRPAAESSGDGDPRWDVYDDCEAVACASWQATANVGNTLSHDETRSFYRDAHAAAARLGMIDVNVVYVGERPVSFIYNYHYAGCVSGIRTGFDPAFDGMGSTVVLKTLEDSCRLGDTMFDFGPGEWEYKRRLRTRVESSYRLTYMPLISWRSQAVHLTRWAKSRIGSSGETMPLKAVPA